MPSDSTTSGMLDHDDIMRRFAELGLKPVTGGSGDDDDGADDGDDQDDANKDAAGSGANDGKSKDGDDSDGATGLKSALDKERDARRLAEKTLRTAQKRLTDLESAGKTESQRVADERDAFKTSAADYRDKYRSISARESIRTEAIKLGADPTKVDRIVRMVKADVAFDDDGDEPTNLKTLLADLRKSDEDLFKPAVGKSDAGAGKRSKPNEDQNAWLRKAAGRSA